MKKEISIKGMHCRSCEIMIEDEMNKLPGVQKVSVNHHTGIATVHSDRDIAERDIEKAVQNAGYTLGVSEEQAVLSRDAGQYARVGLSIAVIYLIASIASELGVMDLLLVRMQATSLFSSLILGIAAGFSTCMAIVGGLLLGITVRYSSQSREGHLLSTLRSQFLFHGGRVVSFVVGGFVLGALGSLVQIATGINAIMIGAAGLVMLVLGIQLTGLSPRFSSYSFSLPPWLARRLGVTKLPQSGSDAAVLVAGALTFFLPCGFTQSVQVYALSVGDPVVSAITMGVFALGTIPGLFTLSFLPGLARGSVSRYVLPFVGVLTILFGAYTLTNALQLGGIRIDMGKTNNEQTVQTAPLVNGKQQIAMVQQSTGYEPDEFTVKKGVPVEWKVRSADPYSCASSLVVRELDIRTRLTEKEQTFSFTPQKEGDIVFTCSMGMYSGVIHVIK